MSKKEVSVKAGWKECEKKESHSGLMPCSKFLENPKKCFEDAKIEYSISLEKCVVSSVILTVRLVVSFISLNNQSKKMYRHNVMTQTCTGTGFILDTEPSNKKCRCEKCKGSNKNDHQTWSVYIATATHVVKKNTDANFIKAKLFYHDKTKRETVKEISEVESIKLNVDDDSCVIEFLTCDQKLIETIVSALQDQKLQHKKLPEESDKVVIISHPHGMPKYISFGSFTVLETKQHSNITLSKLIYNASTCQGSSGAPVLMLSNKCKGRFSNIACEFVVNKSEIAPVFDTKRSTTTYEDTGDIEENNVIHVPRTPGIIKACHSGFFPKKELELKHLPSGYQDVGLLRCTRALSNLTVRLLMKFTSCDRPEFVPGPKNTYPYYNTKGKDIPRTGHGTIVSVLKQDNIGSDCPCPECTYLYNTTPSKISYLVFVITAAHIVFDDSEARNCFMRFSFNNQLRNISVYGLGMAECSNDLNSDRKTVIFVSHDEFLCKYLSKCVFNFYSIEKLIADNYRSGRYTDQLTVIVTHSQDNTKLVSIGQSIYQQKVDLTQENELKQYLNITCNFPDFNGAAVYRLGTFKMARFSLAPHVHYGAKGDKNVSTYGFSNFIQHDDVFQSLQSEACRVVNIINVYTLYI